MPLPIHNAILLRLNPRTKALLAMFLASFMFSLMAISTKWASQSTPDAPAIPAAQISFARYVSGVVAMLFMWKVYHADIWGTKRRGLIWRGISGGIAATCFFMSIQWTTLTHATLLNQTFVIWAPVYAIFVLNERLTRVGVLSITVAICGVALVTKPQIGHVHPGDALALLSGIVAGLAVVQIRRLRKTETSYAIFFYFNLIGLPMSLIALSLTQQRFLIPNTQQWIALCSVGVVGVLAQLLMTYSYRELSAALGSLITLTSVALTALLSSVLFKEPLTFTTIVGGAMILGSTFALAVLPNLSRSPTKDTMIGAVRDVEET